MNSRTFMISMMTFLLLSVTLYTLIGIYVIEWETSTISLELILRKYISHGRGMFLLSIDTNSTSEAGGNQLIDIFFLINSLTGVFCRQSMAVFINAIIILNALILWSSVKGFKTLIDLHSSDKVRLNS